jgi:hypothetical protein
MKNETRDKFFYGSLLLTYILWRLIFVDQLWNFWLMMSASTILLIILAFILSKPLFKSRYPKPNDLLIGFFSALLLYGIFWLGNQTLIVLEDIFPSILQTRTQNIQAVYANRGSLSRVVVGILLFFPIGFGEEVFWRGYIQRYMSGKTKPWIGFIITTIFYTTVHIATQNPILLLASFVCGLYWGGMYLFYKHRLWPVVISHMLWDPLIFIIFPI